MRRAAENISLQDAERRIFVQVASQVGLTARGDNIFRELQKRVLRWGFDPSRDGRLGFRLYHFWDAETGRVVVGYLPGHLKNDIS